MSWARLARTAKHLLRPGLGRARSPLRAAACQPTPWDSPGGCGHAPRASKGSACAGRMTPRASVLDCSGLPPFASEQWCGQRVPSPDRELSQLAAPGQSARRAQSQPRYLALRCVIRSPSHRFNFVLGCFAIQPVVVAADFDHSSFGPAHYDGKSLPVVVTVSLPCFTPLAAMSSSAILRMMLA